MDRASAEHILLNAGTDPDCLDDADRIAFLAACKEGPDELVAAFLAAGMAVSRPSDQEPPIIKAAEGDDIERILLLLSHGASLEQRDLSLDSPLHTAANWGHAELVRQLIAIGARPETTNHKGWTPLSYALYKQNREIVRALLEGGADPDFSGTSSPPLLFAIERPDMIELLLSHGADINRLDPAGESALMLATRLDRPDVVRLLMARGALDRPNRHGWTAHMLAEALGFEAVRRALEEGGAEPRDIQFYSVIEAARAGDVAALRRLLEDEGQPIDRVDCSGCTALLHAADQRHEHVAAWLIGRGAQVDCVDNAGQTVLSLAARDQRRPWLDFLLDAGAAADQPAGHSQALLVAACRWLEGVERLLAAGATVNCVDVHGQSPLYLACASGQEEIAACLLAAGAHPDGGGDPDHVPLLIAAQYGHAGCVRRLVDAGASLELRDPALGETALLKACGGYENTDPRFAEVVRALVAAGADWRAHGRFGTATPCAHARSSRNGPSLQALTELMTTGWLSRFVAADGSFDAAAAAAQADPEVLTVLLEEGHEEPVLAMVEAGLPPERLTEGPRRPIFAALSLPTPRLALALLARGLDVTVTDFGQTLLTAAATSGHLELVERLLEAGVPVDAMPGPYNGTALGSAAARGHLAVMERLVAAGARLDLPRAGASPLIRAVRAGQAAAVRWLLARGAPTDVRTRDGSTPLDLARRKGDPELVALFSGAQVDPAVPREVSPLPPPPPRFRALHRGELRADALQSSDVALVDGRGDTLLHHACRRGLYEHARRLLELGASPLQANPHGETPWALATVWGGTQELAELVLAHGGRLDPDAQAQVMLNSGPFRVAFREGDLVRLAEILQQGQVPLDALSQGSSPLGMAVSRGDREMVELLLALGADPLARSGQHTPLSLAEELGDPALVALLHPEPLWPAPPWLARLPPRAQPRPLSPSTLAEARDALQALLASAGRRSWQVARQARRTRRTLERLGGLDPAHHPELRDPFEAVLAHVPTGRLPLRIAMELLLELDCAAFARAVRRWSQSPLPRASSATVQRLSHLLDQLHPELALRLGAALTDGRSPPAVLHRRLDRVRSALEESGRTLEEVLEGIVGEGREEREMAAVV
jgi:ankyrin repeat protein